MKYLLIALLFSSLSYAHQAQADITGCDVSYMGGTISFAWTGPTRSAHSGFVSYTDTTPPISGFIDLNQNPTTENTSACKLYNISRDFHCTLRIAHDLIVTDQYQAWDANHNPIPTEAVCPGNVCKNVTFFIALNYEFASQSALMSEIPNTVTGANGTYLQLTAIANHYNTVSCH